MFEHVSSLFNSLSNPDHKLTVLMAPDGDVHLVTQRFDGEGGFQHASVRLRMFNGGGHNVLLRNILANMILKDQRLTEPDFLNQMYAESIPNDYREFRFRCDDNPGSHLNIALGERLFGFQTNCHDEERDWAADGYSMQGDGPMVWLPRDLFPNVYKDLKSGLIDGKNPNKILYGDAPFSMMKLEAA